MTAPEPGIPESGVSVPGVPGPDASVPGAPVPEVPVPDPSAALAEIAVADPETVDPQLVADYAHLLRRVPGALHRDGEAFGSDGRRIHLTASALVMDRDLTHLGLLWHPRGAFWVQPGGHVEPGETSLEASARREVAEELGLNELERLGPGPVLLHRHALSDAFGACGEHWDVRYLLRASAPAAQLERIPSPEGHTVQWVPWPRDAAGAWSRKVDLPEGTVADLAAALAHLAPALERWALTAGDAPHRPER